MFSPIFDEEWPTYFNNLSNEFKERVAKKIKQTLEFPKKRHLHGKASFIVAEVGQNRIIYKIFEKDNIVKFYFVGNHKEYEKWYKKYF